MERLSIYFTRTHSSVEVQELEGVTRNTSAKAFPSVLNNMPEDDRQLLVRFCQSVIECVQGDCRKLQEWQS